MSGALFRSSSDERYDNGFCRKQKGLQSCLGCLMFFWKFKREASDHRGTSSENETRSVASQCLTPYISGAQRAARDMRADGGCDEGGWASECQHQGFQPDAGCMPATEKPVEAIRTSRNKLKMCLLQSIFHTTECYLFSYIIYHHHSIEYKLKLVLISGLISLLLILPRIHACHSEESVPARLWLCEHHRRLSLCVSGAHSPGSAGDRSLLSRCSRAARVPSGSLADNSAAQKPNTLLNPLSGGGAGVSYRGPCSLLILFPIFHGCRTSPPANIFHFPILPSIANLQRCNVRVFTHWVFPVVSGSALRATRQCSSRGRWLCGGGFLDDSLAGMMNTCRLK